MSNKIKNILSLVVLPLALLLGGCSIADLFGGGGDTELPPVGIYRSTDKGDTWATANDVLSTTGRPTLNTTNVRTLMFDPTDRQTLYLGSTNHGLFYTYDNANRWWQSGPIRSGAINAVAVVPQPELRCTLYVATENRILKTQDCGRFWDQEYYDTRLNERVLTLLVHQTEPDIVYAGLTTGDVLLSTDAGQSWETLSRLSGDVLRLIQHNLDPNTFYAVVHEQGIWKSVDAGETWENMSKEWSKIGRNTLKVTDVAVDVNRPDTLIASSTFGLLRTTDGGETWTKMNLLTGDNEAKISAVAMNPQNPREIYYTTDTTLYRTTDGGETWETRLLPVTSATFKLLVDPKLENALYLGVNRPVKQSGFGF